MTQLVVHRPARTRTPQQGVREIPVAGPPQLPPPPQGGPAQYLQYGLPAVGGLGALVFVLANPRPLFIVGGILFASTSILIGVGLAVQQRSGASHKRLQNRVRYLEYLDGLRAQLRSSAVEQAADARERNPAPEAIWQVTRARTRLWERRRRDPDFLDLRVGFGEVPLITRPRLDGAGGPLTDVDPICLAEAERFVRRHATLPRQPLSVPLSATGVLSVVGPRWRARELTRALVAQAAAWHAPEDVRIAIAGSSETAIAWAWVKWLPHARHPEISDAVGEARLFSGQPDELRSLLLPEIESRQRRRAQARGATAATPAAGHLIVVVDGEDVRGSGSSTGDTALDSELADPSGLGITVVHLVGDVEDEPSHVDVRLDVDQNGRLWVQPRSADVGIDGSSGTADGLNEPGAETLARHLAPLRLSAESTDSPDADTINLTETLGFDPEALDPERAWRRRPDPEWLRVPVGVTPEGSPVHLDLKEPALGGMGPHGLLVGATGSGKSELLRTLVVSLAATHPPERLNLVLADFKGGATFAGLAELPHVGGMITNLQDDLALVDRFHDALRGEMQRRQELLRSAGNYASVHDYETARSSGADLAPLPSLFVVVDEFSELLSAQPEFIDMFVAIGRLGRSLGMHLLLASQRLEEGKLRGLDSHLSYRLGLRTFSSVESRTVLGVPDAYELPPIPGSGFLKVDTSVFQRFRAAYVSAPLPRPKDTQQVESRGVLLPFTASNQQQVAEAATPTFQPVSDDEPSVLELVVERLRDAGPQAHQVWLPPLGVPPTLDTLLPGLDTLPQRGLAATSWPEHGKLRVPVGIVDKPHEQAREHLVMDLSGSGGNVGVAGGTRSGKTTALRTLVGAAALTHTPDEMQFYCLDFGGGGLSALDALPHVGTVATRLEPELVRRLVTEIATLLEEREQRFRRSGVDSAATMRTMRAAGRFPEEERGDVFLVVDGWAALRRDFEDLEPVILEIATRGLGYGIHVVLAANRWFDVKPAVREALGTKLELRIGDTLESEIDRKAAANVPQESPGRGLTAGKYHCQVALPRIDGVPTDDELAKALTDFGERAAAAWHGPGAPQVRMLPPRVSLTELPTPSEASRPGVPVGLGESDLDPVYLDLSGAEAHFLVFGDSRSGKTTFLRTYLQGLTQRYTPEQARIVVVDYRRTLLEAVPESHQLAYAASGPALGEIIEDLQGSLSRRLPGADVTARQLRERSWWSGPDVYVVVDDHDLAVTPSSNPLGSLVEILPQARDVGLHVILARRVGGAGRAAYEPVIQRLKELATPGLILSGDRGEGPILGPYRATEQPAGRGLFVSRSARTQLVQLAIDDE